VDAACAARPEVLSALTLDRAPVFERAIPVAEGESL
jgi:hypothetical protein